MAKTKSKTDGKNSEAGEASKFKWKWRAKVIRDAKMRAQLAKEKCQE